MITMRWRRILLGLAGLYFVSWVGTCIWSYRHYVEVGYKVHMWEVVSNSNLLQLALLVFLCIAIPLSLLVGVAGAFRSKYLATRWKVLITSLILVVVVEGLLVAFIRKHPASLPLYSFYEQKAPFPDSHVSMKGTWISDTNLAEPNQTTRIDCWKDYGLCIEMTAYIGFGNMLHVNPTYWEIQEWTPEKIVVKENTAPLCVNENLIVDRKNKTAIRVRVTKSPKPEGCEGIEDEPIVSHLANGPGPW